MIDNSVDKGTLTIVVRNTGNGFDLCEMGYSLNPGEEIVDINYENGSIFLMFEDGKSIIGSYETTPSQLGAKVFHDPSQRVIGRVGAELINFIRKDADPDAGRLFPDEECLAYYSQSSGRISLTNNLFSTWGIIDGSEIGGAAAFIAIFFAYRFNSMFRDFFVMEEHEFKQKYSSYLNAGL
jgi:hypothetical protein